jgi:predicted nucleotidyltransferase
MTPSDLREQIISTFKAFNPQKIILFGSAVHDEWDQIADVDLIIVYETDKRFLSRLKDLYMVWDMPKAADILAYTPSEFQDMISDSQFIKEEVATGEVIYERG